MELAPRPGPAYGASLGFSISATVLAWLGLAFLFVAVGKGLIDMAVLVQQAVVRAWKAADHPSDQRSWEVQQAGRDLARAMGMLMLLVLQAVVAWVLKKGIDKKAELLAELRKSKLGEGFAKWVDANLDRLMSDPRLRGHRGEGSSAKAPEEPAKSPSQIKREREEESIAETALPPLRQQYVDEVSTLKSKAAAMREEGASSEQIARTLHADRRSLGEKYKSLTSPPAATQTAPPMATQTAPPGRGELTH